jgi:arginine decarboxylase
MSVSVFPRETDVEGAAVAVPTPYNLPRLRLDTWNRLRDATRRLRGQLEDPAHLETLRRACRNAFETLDAIERYSAFPGHRTLDYLVTLFEAERYADLAAACVRIVRMLSTDSYRRLDLSSLRATDILDLLRRADGAIDKLPTSATRPYFELLIVDDIGEADEAALRLQLRGLRDDSDDFIYEIVVVRSFEDALLALLANPNIEACVLRFSFPFAAPSTKALTDRIFTLLGEDRQALAGLMPGQRTAMLGDLIKRLRPEVDIFRVTSAPIETVAGGEFRRVFYQSEDLYDLHLSVLKGVHDRYETPFFDALREYSERPTGMFHALPVSRGRSVAKSHWIGDFGKFYGIRLFLAETSATTGGLDSLLQPTGSLKVAQQRAARAFGADRTFFVTNGTSTANKIVTQALCRPGDIVLLSHDCHKSHPYAAILGGATPVYLDAYPLTDYSMYGGVTLREIKRQLFELRRAGKLDKVRLLLLTNITFDGITYDPYRVMKEVLAIKPDILFLWDEAWFAYGRFSPILRRRTAMDAAARLDRELHSQHYRAEYERWREDHDRLPAEAESTFVDHPLMPDPDRVRLRVYATQSTHKTLTALRQGSMIHVRDVDFEREASEPFHAAYMTHTSTSPNYQILASLDAGRRQVELEGYDLVMGCLEIAFTLREQINEDPLLSRYFRALSPEQMVPQAHRPSGILRYFDPIDGVGPIERSWSDDEFVLDPTRVTLHVGRTGLDGDTFRKLLMDEHDIHINKTSRNTVLFLIHIGMTRGTIAQLLKTLAQIATELDRRAVHASPPEQAAFDASVRALTEDAPSLPNFSRFHDAFKPDPGGDTPEGDIRRAFFAAYESSLCEFVLLDTELKRAVASGQEFVSAGFVTPYPPGFPVLVPGQVVSEAILDYLLALDVKEIHGYEPELGLRIFSAAALQTQPPTETAMSANGKRRAERRVSSTAVAPNPPLATQASGDKQ